MILLGENLLNDPQSDFRDLEIIATGFENNNRPTQLLKVKEAYSIYKQLIVFYAIQNIIQYIGSNKITSLNNLLESLPQKIERFEWQNIGGQLISDNSLHNLLENTRSGSNTNWDDVHEFYKANADQYKEQKLQHGLASLFELLNISASDLTHFLFKELLNQFINTKEWMVKNIYYSRAKDYQSDFRKMVYNNEEEMEEVIGKLNDNVFILQQRQELEELKRIIDKITVEFGI